MQVLTISRQHSSRKRSRSSTKGRRKRSWQSLQDFTEQAEEKALSPEYILTPGTGKITINKKDIEDYFGLDTLKVIVRQPFAVTGTEGKYDVLVNVYGGGFTGQAGAIRHGIARALNEAR